jgi:hypothetical protein
MTACTTFRWNAWFESQSRGDGVLVSPLGRNISRLPTCRRKTLVVVGLGLLLVSRPPLDWTFTRPPEMWFPIRPFPASQADTIVVLSTAVDSRHYECPYSVLGQDTYSRCRFAAWLRQHWRQLPVLACGCGNAEPALAASMRELLTAGVPDSSIWTEGVRVPPMRTLCTTRRCCADRACREIALVVEAESIR